MDPTIAEQRDLRFKPVVNLNPTVLTREQIEHYNSQGYIKPLNAYSEIEARRNRAYFDYLQAELNVHRPGNNNYAINGFHSRCRGLFNICTHPTILDHVQDIVGPNVIAWGSHFFSKVAHDPKHVPWHQDASYWPLTPARTVTVWLAIDDADVENSAMKFLPGTHNRGHLKWKKTERDAVLGQEIEDADQMGQPVYDELKAGQFSLHADMLAHGSDPNASDRRRCGLTIRYCPPEVTALDPHWANNAILCRGVCDNPTWKFIEPPPGEDLTSQVKHKTIGGN